MRALDYVLDNNDNFWIVYKFNEHEVYGKMVFRVSNNGRYNKITNKYYDKVVNNDGDNPILINNIKKIFNPNKCYMNNKDNLNSDWKNLSSILEEIGIKDKNIGIYGSYLIGFDVEHDIDYVVYGIKSYNLVKSNIKYIRRKLNVTSITNEHINYQSKKYKSLYSEENELDKILKHNWAGLQFKQGVLSTIRFIKKNKHYIDLKGEEKTIEGIVISDKDTNFLPRVGTIKTDNGDIKVITYFWMFNAFLNNDEKVLIKGVYNKERSELYLVNREHWIKYL
jgi:predicted nucleotidyltransferase